MWIKPYLYIYWYIALPGLVLALTRTSSFKSGYFGLAYRDQRLDGYEIEELNVSDPFECSKACIANVNCQSYNYGDTADNDGLHTCQLSDHYVGSSSTMDLVETPGFSYYEEPQMNSRCLPGLCQNGGTCVEIHGSFANCKCAAFYTGIYCDDSKAKDCQDIFTRGGRIDGIYPINPDSNGMIHVYCDQTSTIGVGWIIIQRRSSPFNTSFYRDWNSYKTGFGNLSSEFWLGNEAIHRITKTPRTLVIKLEASDPTSVYGESSYLNFQVSSEHKNYLMDYNNSNYDTNNFGDALQGQKGTMFSTYDRNNLVNVRSYLNCAEKKKSAWWYSNICGASDLNQKSYPLWDTWSWYTKVTKSTMKVK